MLSDAELIEVRDDLCERIFVLERGLPKMSGRDLLAQVHSLKGVARAYGFHGVANLAHALESDIGNEGRGALVTSYLDRMQDAIACGSNDPAVIECLLATVRARKVA